MKRIIVFVCLFALCAAAFTGCGKKVTEKEDILEGEDVIGAKIYENDKLIGAEYYDEDGAVCKTDDYDSDGNTVLEKNLVGDSVRDETEYKYSDGELASSVRTTYKADGSVQQITEDEYVGGKIVCESVKSLATGRETLSVREYTYNDDGSVLKIQADDGNPVSETLTASDGSIVYEKAYSDDGSATKNYYSSGTLTKDETYDGTGALISCTEYTYGTDGSISRTEQYDANGVQMYYSVYRYTDKKVSRISIYKPDGKLWRSAVYDDAGKCTLLDASGNPVSN